jgi:outer membrane protein
MSRDSALRTAVVSVLAFGPCVSATAVAAEPAEGEPPSSSFSLGLGAMTSQSPYAGMDRETEVLPLLHYENEYISIMGPELGIKLPGIELSDSQELNFSIIAKYDGSGYKASDAKILNGMSRRKGGFWAGGKVEWESDLVDVSAEWLTDASGNSKGQIFSLGVEKTWHFGDHVMLTPRLGASWQDKKYVDYYFGVRNSEVRIDRAAYVGKSGVTTEVGVRGMYMFDKTHSMFMDVGVSSLAKEIKDSPLVDRSTENSVFIGYLYSF